MASNNYTSLQVGLAILLVSQFYDYGVVCSYDELVRFRTSAAAWSAKKQSHVILSHHVRKLSLLGELNSDIRDVISEAIDFVGDCYGMPNGKTVR